ncbi:Osw1p KNAG_0J01870 [Huiozyma naganishii CBS 8797]|uniref:Uncharacterized protein n=1 Tax=Huiozyma naganishii (strain ATCC MYA-139 / BCRC 22969 / CBS 8797 / KCTC 17520 / NBRC 10181 / NCYC 3082 / Yp74L-3) TaxID=1071383 RepID=J7RR08_HUIN7|nr:hypothetical protein KNAG_0J01870 [Kazachstania naganishii CBS 8797]CCK72268.1 hypothetical protein KNAG_0J01870 [Kazachstania naganishii CBS 8797]
MRVPPKPRASRLPRFLIRVKNAVCFKRLKLRRKNKRLNKLQYKQSMQAAITNSGLRVEDTFNIPTNFLPRSARNKPLLIANFKRGCDRSPEVKILQKTRLRRLFMSKRRIKMKYFNYHDCKRNNEINNVAEQTVHNNTMQCATNVHTIKTLTRKNADVRVIYYSDNVVKRFSPEKKMETVNGEVSPEYIEFTGTKSVKIAKYPSLRRKGNHTTTLTGLFAPTEVSEEPENLGTVRRYDLTSCQGATTNSHSRPVQTQTLTGREENI